MGHRTAAEGSRAAGESVWCVLMTQVGRVASIYRFPVKSMGGERLPSAAVTLQGLAGDRMHAFVQAGSASPFPWLTGREVGSMLFHQPFAEERDGHPQIMVRTPTGEKLPIGSDELREALEEEHGKPVFLLPNYRGSFDVAPMTLMSLATVEGIARASGTAADPLRFRMNLYVDTGNETPFAEDAWVGRVVRVGADVRIGVTERDRRCVMTTLDQPTSEGSPRVLKAIGELNGAFAGIYGAVLTAGTVNEGDSVTLED
jgi:uncharacterized protein